MRFLYEFLRNDDAATAVEYAVMLALILLTVFAAVGSVGTNASSSWAHSSTSLQNAGLGR